MYTGCLICYGFTGDRFQQLKAIAEDQGVGLRPVGDENLDKTVESLLLPPDQLDNSQVQEIPSQGGYEYLLFAMDSQEKLYHFLDSLHEEGLYVPLKAGLTPNNIHWKLSYLIDQNREEHEYFQAQEKKNQK